MADRVLIISWGEPVRGREQHSLEVLNAVLGFYAEMQEAGRLERFDVILCTPNGLMDGCMMLHGSHQQLDALQEDLRFRKHILDARLVVDDVRIIPGYVGEGIAEALPLYEDAVGHVPQMA